MFKKKEKWIIYAAIFLGLLVSGFLILRQIQYSYHLKMMNLEAGGNLSQTYQNLMVLNEGMTKNFFLIFFCFWLILFGTIIYFTHSERFYDSDFMHDRRFLLKSILPGISMIVIGAVLLAFSLWQFSGIKQAVLAQNADNNIEHGRDKLMLPTDTMVIAKPYIPNLAKKKRLAIPTASIAKKEAITPKQESAAQPAATVKTSSNDDGANNNTAKIPAEEKQWANAVATNTIKYGYYPTRADNKRLKQTISDAPKDDNGEPKADNLWSLSLMQKMQTGYQPTDAEMRRYEHIAENVID